MPLVSNADQNYPDNLSFDHEWINLSFEGLEDRMPDWLLVSVGKEGFTSKCWAKDAAKKRMQCRVELESVLWSL